eukprot:TRINITY_DN293_c0_g1_i1.p1 TRINITY_DN293_c0_g1~~TRINITY_DN293_c0_g1_i1.p1  ORF type:complete len:259 (-),score=45.22 TRINITY_DN293_c0_g1_i1:47-802(-)
MSHPPVRVHLFIRHHAQFVSDEGGAVHGAAAPNPHTVWLMEFTGADDSFAFKGSNGKYLTAEKDGKVAHDRQTRGDFEVWHLENQEDGTVGLKSHHKKYLCMEGNLTLIADRKAVGGWESFVILPVPNDKISIRAFESGFFLSGKPDFQVIADAVTAHANEAWTVVYTPAGPPGGFALRSAHGRFLCAQPDGRVVADREAPGERESFYLQTGFKGWAIRTHYSTFIQFGPEIRCEGKKDGKKETWVLENVA